MKTRYAFSKEVAMPMRYAIFLGTNIENKRPLFELMVEGAKLRDMIVKGWTERGDLRVWNGKMLRSGIFYFRELDKDTKKQIGPCRRKIEREC